LLLGRELELQRGAVGQGWRCECALKRCQR
jgi:hypothetical protein